MAAQSCVVVSTHFSACSSPAAPWWRLASRSTPIDTAILARFAHCSARRLQRDFTCSAGVTPREHGRSLRTTLACATLRGVSTVTETILDAGHGTMCAFDEEAGRRLGIHIAVASPRPLRAVYFGTDAATLGDASVAAAQPAAPHLGRLVRLHEERT